ncbi:hypothetical protein KKC00_01330, partial [Patescibacteria group bacterium]|nr:hypothetical protein [Patescibacteria group bacterium]
ATEPGTRGYIGFPKWRKYLKHQTLQEKVRLRETIKLVTNEFQTVDDFFDIVVGFSLEKPLQRKEAIADIVSKSNDLIVLTAHKTGVDNLGMTDAEFVDQSILQQPAISILQRMKKLDFPTNDGYLWLLRNQSCVH